jgi:hypothetical protein
MSPSEIRRRREFKKKMQQSQAYRKPSQGMPGAGTAAGSASAGQSAQGRTAGIARHRCEVCGRTEITNPELEFRYCSKCSGQHEYCQDHLFTHQHVK